MTNVLQGDNLGSGSTAFIVCQSFYQDLSWYKVYAPGNETLLNGYSTKYSVIMPFSPDGTVFQTELIIRKFGQSEYGIFSSDDFRVYKCVNSYNKSSQVNLTLSTSKFMLKKTFSRITFRK